VVSPAASEAALRREIREEIASRADIVSLVQMMDSGAGDERQYFYLGQIASWDSAARTRPEFGEPGRGSYRLEQIPLTAPGLASIDLQSAAIAGLLRDVSPQGVTCSRCRIRDRPRPGKNHVEPDGALAVGHRPSARPPHANRRPVICQTEEMNEARAAEVIAESAVVLRNARARFAYLHGSRASGQYRPDSDVDIAAYFGGQPPNSFDILMPPGVDLLVLDHAPLELAGRVAARGRLLFDDDPVSRVRWEATTRKIYFDELPRITRAHREFAASVTGRRG
jgi:predicted nucleotidyltransferase